MIDDVPASGKSRPAESISDALVYLAERTTRMLVFGLAKMLILPAAPSSATSLGACPAQTCQILLAANSLPDWPALRTRIRATQFRRPERGDVLVASLRTRRNVAGEHFTSCRAS